MGPDAHSQSYGANLRIPELQDQNALLLFPTIAPSWANLTVPIFTSAQFSTAIQSTLRMDRDHSVALCLPVLVPLPNLDEKAILLDPATRCFRPHFPCQLVRKAEYDNPGVSPRGNTVFAALGSRHVSLPDSMSTSRPQNNMRGSLFFSPRIEHRTVCFLAPRGCTPLIGHMQRLKPWMAGRSGGAARRPGRLSSGSEGERPPRKRSPRFPLRIGSCSSGYGRAPPTTPVTPATEGFSRRKVRQGGISLRCRRFQGTYLVLTWEEATRVLPLKGRCVPCPQPTNWRTTATPRRPPSGRCDCRSPRCRRFRGSRP